jgi:transcriptional regulator with XRE-family HTH domain
MKSARNDPGSLALVSLRKEMRMTQQEFAVQVLDSALTTISRYESGNPPPRGPVLIRFRDIAREQGLMGLADQFQAVWLQDAHKILGPEVATLVKEEDESGFLVASLDPEDLTDALSYLRKLSLNRRKRKEAAQ